MFRIHRTWRKRWHLLGNIPFMRGRAILLLSTFLLFTIPAFPQCDYHLLSSSGYRASIFDIWIDGNDLWAATGYGVQLFDRTVDPPRLIGSVSVPGLTRVVRAANGIAYAGGGSGIAVIRRNGNSLQLVRTIATASVNDLLLRPTVLIAGTTNGIAEFDLIDPINPARNNAAFGTTSNNILSLAATGSTLYVADGDASIETFSIVVPSSPQKNPSLTSLARPSSVDVIGSRLYVSDGQRTEVFNLTGNATLSLGTFAYPATSIADAGANVVIVAGSDRQLRVIDATLPENSVELFEAELPPSGGNVNRITAFRIAGGRLYVAGGDSGITTYDVSRFGPPFPLQAYAIGATTSVVVQPNAIYVARAGTGIQEMNRGAAGGLVLARQWSPATEIVHDGGGGFLISSSGTTLKFWTLASLVPSLISSVTFPSPVQTAFLTNARVTALLQDGTLWTADMSQATPAAVKVAIGHGAFSQLARSGSTFAATEVSAAGDTTIIHVWSGDLNAAPVDVGVPGISTALALSGQTAAAFTFRGIIVANAGSGALTVLPGSNSEVVTALEIANGKVIALTEQSKVRIWNLTTSALEKEMFVPGQAMALDTEQDSMLAGVATASGVAAVDYGTSTKVPALLARIGGNTYYKKAVASPTRLYLFDGRVVDIYEIASTSSPHWIASVFAPGTIDIAASETMLFTLSNAGLVSEFSSQGVLARTATATEGGDAIPLAVNAVAGAPWVSFSTGCTTGNCEKRTSVLDPQSLVRTASLTGSVIDVTAAGTRAYALTDLPAEIRVLNVSDPLHPSPVVTRATDVSAVAIAANNGTVYLLGDKVYAYSESALTRTGEQLASVQPSSFADLLIDSGCATIAGRTAAAETYTLPQWTAGSTLPLPGSIRALRVGGGKMIILTDYSIEIWSRGAAPQPPKRRAVS